MNICLDIDIYHLISLYETQRGLKAQKEKVYLSHC